MCESTILADPKKDGTAEESNRQDTEYSGVNTISLLLQNGENQSASGHSSVAEDAVPQTPSRTQSESLIGSTHDLELLIENLEKSDISNPKQKKHMMPNWMKLHGAWFCWKSA